MDLSKFSDSIQRVELGLQLQCSGQKKRKWSSDSEEDLEDLDLEPKYLWVVETLWPEDEAEETACVLSATRAP